MFETTIFKTLQNYIPVVPLDPALTTMSTNSCKFSNEELTRFGLGLQDGKRLHSSLWFQRCRIFCQRGRSGSEQTWLLWKYPSISSCDEFCRYSEISCLFVYLCYICDYFSTFYGETRCPRNRTRITERNLLPLSKLAFPLLLPLALVSVCRCTLTFHLRTHSLCRKIMTNQALLWRVFVHDQDDGFDLSNNVPVAGHLATQMNYGGPLIVCLHYSDVLLAAMTGVRITHVHVIAQVWPQMASPSLKPRPKQKSVRPEASKQSHLSHQLLILRIILRIIPAGVYFTSTEGRTAGEKSWILQ